MLNANNLWRLVGGVALAVVLIAWTLAFSHIRDVRNDSRQETERHTERLAQTYATHAALSLAVADEALLRLRELALRENASDFARDARIISRSDTAGGVSRVALIDADGRMLASFVDGEEAKRMNVADRDYFQALKGADEDRLFITEPFVGRASSKWIVLFARPLRVDGKFAGVIFAGFETGQLGRLFQTADREGTAVTLLSPGGHVVTRSFDAQNATGKQVELPPEALRDSGIFDYTSPIDGIKRLSASRAVDSWGLRVIAGVDRQRLARELAEHERIAILPAALLTLLLAAATLIVRQATRALHRAENERRAEAARSHTVLESMTEGVLLIDRKGTISFANDAAQFRLANPGGQPFAAALAAAGLSLVTEEGLPFAVADPINYLCLHHGQNVDGAWLLGNAGQHQRWLSLRARPLSEADGRIDGAIVTIVDRTDEHERMADAEMSKAVLTKMNDAVLITDAAANILMANAAFLQISGYREADIVGKPPAVFGSARHDDAFWAAVWQALTQAGQWSGKIWNRRKDGGEYCVWQTITAVRDPRGRIVRYVAVSRDITEQQAQEADLWQRANFDPLTGLANRTRFEDRLAQAFQHAARHQHLFAVCYLDLDRFKPVNDTLGHAAGDALLRQVAQRMQAIVRQEDTLARIGGDEFALYMPRLKTADDADRVAAKIIAALDQPFLLDEGTASIGVSIGVALYPQHGGDAATLTTAADRALYVAKAEGRNTWRLATTAEPPLEATA